MQGVRPEVTPEPNEAGYPQAVRNQAVRMYVDELNFRRIARTLQVNHQSVINWVNAHVARTAGYATAS